MNHGGAMQIPHDQLSPQALRGLIEEFVTRDGTDYGTTEASLAATATVGLSTGISHAHLHPVLKGILCFDMLAGRLEIIALLVLLYPGTWFGKKAESI